MSNVRLLIKNELDDTSVSATNEVATLPATNLKKESHSYVFRTSAKTTVITGTLTTPVLADLFCIGRYSFTAGATVTLTLKLSTTTVFSGTIQSTLGMIPLGQFIIGVDEFGGTVDIGDKIAFTIFDKVVFDNFTLDIDDSAYNTDGYFDVGRLFFGQSFSPTYNYSYNAPLTLNDEIEHKRASDGSLRSINSGSYKEASISLEWLDDVDRLLLEQQFLTNPRNKEMLYIADPENTGVKAALNTMICKRADPSRFVHDFYNNNTTQFTFIES